MALISRSPASPPRGSLRLAMSLRAKRIRAGFDMPALVA
jgi:hypothetical protein